MRGVQRGVGSLSHVRPTRASNGNSGQIRLARRIHRGKLCNQTHVGRWSRDGNLHLGASQGALRVSGLHLETSLTHQVQNHRKETYGRDRQFSQL